MSSEKLNIWTSSAALLIVLLTSAVILIFFRFLPPKLPLFYSLPWGDKQLASHEQFFIIPAALVAVTFLNLVVSWQLHNSQWFFKRILTIGTSVYTLILTITFIKVILIFI